jgi:hypothetical protein
MTDIYINFKTPEAPLGMLLFFLTPLVLKHPNNALTGSMRQKGNSDMQINLKR